MISPSQIITPNDFRPRYLDLNYSHPVCPVWATVAGASGSGRIAKAWSKVYPGHGVLNGTDSSYEPRAGWRMVNDPGTAAAQISRVDFDAVGRTDDGDFTFAVWYAPESDTEANGWAMSKGGISNQAPTLGIGARASVTRFCYGWNGTGTSLGGNGDYIAGEPVLGVMRYNASTNVVDLDFINLLGNVVRKTFQGTGKTWPSTVDPSLQLGGFRRTSTLYYDPIEGTIDRAYYYNRYINEHEIQLLANNPNAVFNAPAFLSTFAAPPVGGLSIPIAMYHYRHHNR